MFLVKLIAELKQLREQYMYLVNETLTETSPNLLANVKGMSSENLAQFAVGREAENVSAKVRASEEIDEETVILFGDRKKRFLFI